MVQSIGEATTKAHVLEALQGLGLSQEVLHKVTMTVTREEQRREALATMPAHYRRLKDVADELGIRRDTISMWVIRGRVHAVKVTGKETWVDPADVRRCLDKDDSKDDEN